jgi:tartrate dehydratase beta subunit/fumarate hydratase class I family protein
VRETESKRETESQRGREERETSVTASFIKTFWLVNTEANEAPHSLRSSTISWNCSAYESNSGSVVLSAAPTCNRREEERFQIMISEGEVDLQPQGQLQPNVVEHFSMF